MANQRKKGQKLVGAFVSEKIHAALVAEAKLRGISVADLIREEIAKMLPKKP